MFVGSAGHRVGQHHGHALVQKVALSETIFSSHSEACLLIDNQEQRALLVNRLFPLPFTSTCSASPPGSVPGMEDTCGFLSVWIKLGSTKGRVIGDKVERGT